MDLFAPTHAGSGGGLRLSLTVRRRDNVLTLVGDLDVASAGRLDHVLRGLEITHRPLCLDLAHLRFADSIGWAVVEDSVRRRRSVGAGGVHVVNMPRQVRRLVDVLALVEAGCRTHAAHAMTARPDV